MMNIYPPEVRAWIGRHGGLRPQMIFLRGQELAEYVPTCAESDIPVVHSVTHRALKPSHHGRTIVAFRPSRYRVFAVRPY